MPSPLDPVHQLPEDEKKLFKAILRIENDKPLNIKQSILNLIKATITQ